MKTRNLEKLVLFVIIALSCSGCGQKNSIEADIKGLGSDTLFVMFWPFSIHRSADFESLLDTVFSFNDKFSYEPQYADTSMLFICPRKGFYTGLQGEYNPKSNYIFLLWIKNQKIKIKGEFTKHFVDYEIEGSEFNQVHSLIRRNSLKHLAQITQIDIKIDSMHAFPSDVHLIDSLYQERKKAEDSIEIAEIEYLLNNPDAELSGFYLSKQQSDTIVKYHNRLSERVRNGLFKGMIDYRLTKIEIWKNNSLIKQGNIAPDFTLPSIDGDSLSLYSIDSKFIVLYFWENWWESSLSDLPKMKEYYDKYHKTVEFIGISSRNEESEWKKTVDTLQLKWKNVIDNSGNVSVKYAITTYPTKIILDKDKKIISVSWGDYVNFYDKLDEIMK